MPPDTIQPTTPPEPAPTLVEPQSTPVVDTVATPSTPLGTSQSHTEPVPASTAISDTPTVPSVAPSFASELRQDEPEAPTGTVTPYFSCQIYPQRTCLLY